MLKAGYIQTLNVNRFTLNGAYLIDDEENEVLLPNRYIDEKTHDGEAIEVFLYHDSEDRLVASTVFPHAVAGEVACMEVIDTNSAGAFLDWGLPKDLFLPLSNQQHRVEVGHWCVVGVYIDELSGRVVATASLNKMVSNSEINLTIGQKVEIVVAQQHEYGFRVVVNNTNWGMIYNDQMFQEVELGDILTAYVTKITEDDRIDLSLQMVGVKQIRNASDILLALLEKNNGELELGDKSSPEEIHELTRLSKKMFKRAVGGLLKLEKIAIEPTKIKLL